MQEQMLLHRGATCTDKQKPASVTALLYKKTGEPLVATLWVLPVESVALASTTAAVVCVANITAARCKRVQAITLGRVLGEGAFGRVHIGACANAAHYASSPKQ